MQVLILRPCRKDNIYFRTIEEREKIKYHTSNINCSAFVNLIRTNLGSI